jgi:hypothetical protein
MEDTKYPSVFSNAAYYKLRLGNTDDLSEHLLAAQIPFKCMNVMVKQLKLKGLSREDIFRTVKGSAEYKLCLQHTKIYREKIEKLDTSFSEDSTVHTMKNDPAIRPLTKILSKGTFNKKAMDFMCGTGIKSKEMFKDSTSETMDINDFRICHLLKFTLLPSLDLFSTLKFGNFSWVLMVNCEHFLEYGEFEKRDKNTNYYCVRAVPTVNTNDEKTFVEVNYNNKHSGLRTVKQRIIPQRVNESLTDAHFFSCYFKYTKADVEITDITYTGPLKYKNKGLSCASIEYFKNVDTVYQKVDGYNAILSVTKNAAYYLERGKLPLVVKFTSNSEFVLQLERRGKIFHLISLLEFDGFSGLFTQVDTDQILDHEIYVNNSALMMQARLPLNQAIKCVKDGVWEGVIVKKGLPLLESYLKMRNTIELSNRSTYLPAYGLKTPLHDYIGEYAISIGDEGTLLDFVKKRPDKTNPSTENEFKFLLSAPTIERLISKY